MPIIQLDFNNPLNTSVQVGDTAYFSNPSAVPGSMQHVHGIQPPPHDTSGQDEIIKIGEIIAIGDWDGTISYIQCDMDQALFNKYANQIKAQCMFAPGSAINVNTNQTLLDRINNNRGIANVTQVFNKPPHNVLPDHSNKTKNVDLVADPSSQQTSTQWPNQNPSSYDQQMVHDFVFTQAFSAGNHSKWIGEASDSFLFTAPPDNSPASTHRYYQGTGIGNYMGSPINVSDLDSGIPLHPSATPYLFTSPTTPNIVCGPSGVNLNVSPPIYGIDCNYKWVTVEVFRIFHSVPTSGGPYPVPTKSVEYAYTANQAIQFLLSEGAVGISQNTSSFADVKAAAADINFYLHPTFYIPAFASYPQKTCNNVGSFIMFSKDNKVNQLDMLGYYAAVEYRNNSTEEAELFNVGATYFGSSK